MLHEVSFKSFNERDMVQGWVYVPACEPKGIIQLVHGFGEHSRRYFHMIVAFMDAGFIVAGESYAQGSSREHAAICPMYLGVRAVLAISIERIHAANLVNFGILPLYFTDPADYEAIQEGSHLRIEKVAQQILNGDEVQAELLAADGDVRRFTLKCTLTAEDRRIVLAGGILNA